jgi:hypothetical protein
MQNVNFPNGNLVMDDMQIDLNMLHTLVLNWLDTKQMTMTLSQ